MQQEVTVNELERILAEKRLDCLIGEFGKGYHRKIDYLVGPREYVVLDHHETVWNGFDADAALTAYYNIPRRR